MKAVAGGSHQRNSTTGNQVTRRKPVKVRLNHRFIRFGAARFIFRRDMTTSLLINSMIERRADNDKGE
jgi:hypothetical protein